MTVHYKKMISMMGVICFLLATVYASYGLGKDSTRLPLDLEFKLLIKASTYNRAQKQKDPEMLRIGLLHTQEDHSKDYVQQILKKFGTLDLKVRQYRFTLIPMPVDHQDNLISEAQKDDIHIFYVAPGTDTQLPAILQASESLKVLTITGVSDYVYEGLTLGVSIRGSRPEFLYNEDHASRDGTDFDSNFLRMVRVINH